MITEEQINEYDKEYRRTQHGFIHEKEEGFRLGMKKAIELMQPEWISVTERLPERQQRVIFVIKSNNERYNGKVYGGVYTDPEFAMPGICFDATHWTALPEPPNAG